MYLVSEVHHLRAHKCTNTLSSSDQVLILLRSAGYGPHPRPALLFENVIKLHNCDLKKFESNWNKDGFTTWEKLES